MNNLSVVSYFFLLFESHHFCMIFTTVGFVLLDVLQMISVSLAKSQRKRMKLEGFLYFPSVLYMFSLMFFSLGIVSLVKEQLLRL